MVETSPKILLSSSELQLAQMEVIYAIRGKNECYLVHLKMLSLTPALKGQSKSAK